jgi:capsular exopolysaccharide synthesis family protein
MKASEMPGIAKLPVFFRFFSDDQLTRQFGSLQVNEVEKYATSATVTLRTIYKDKGKVFLDRHLDRWLEEELAEKNQTAVNTLRFINQQLDVTRDSLNLIKKRMEGFRRSHDVILLEQQLGDLYANRKLAEEELLRLKLTRDRLTDLRLYIGQRETNAELIVPVVNGLNSEVLASAVIQLIETRSLLNGLRDKDKNPYSANLEKEERTQLALVKEAIAELMRYTANEIRLTETRLQGYVAEQFALPAMEQEYLELKRVFDLNDKMYNLLRTRKVETEVMKAAATPDSRVLEYASDAVQVAPKHYIILAGFLGGLALPAAVIIGMGLLDVKINDDEDLRRITSLPILGHIIRNDQPQALVTYDAPAIPLTETFRALRSSFNFLLQGRPAQVIVVTSSNSGEGKSFCAMNLAGLYARTGKRTILLGFDLRKHGLNAHFGLHHQTGITDLLVGHAHLEDAILNYKPNFDVLFAGTLPPNPSDLTEGEETTRLLSQLKERYDHIIIDTSPVGLVTDALPLATQADINLYVVRPGVSFKKSIEPTLLQLEKSGVKHIGLVMNGLDPAERHISYGYGYTAAT